MLKTKLFGAAFALFLTGNVAQAKLVQILHTNDTHSFLDSATHKKGAGGSARLKSLIDQFKNEGQKSGMENLVLDAGDFLEGNSYYMAEGGMKSFEVHNNVGYDMVALGNHDYLMGAKELDNMLGKIDLNFSFLAANVTVGDQYPNIQKKISPYKEIDIDGIKVAILGLTTNEFFYTWSLENSKITNPYDAAEKYEEILKKRNNDFIIALTHMGVGKDQKLAKKSKNIDLIVGGHSHTALFEAVYETNKSKRRVPIVQAGMHTEYLGRLIVDLVKGEPLKVVSYELVPVTNPDQDQVVKDIVADADVDLANTYGEEWLNEKIGMSDLKADDADGSKKWSFYITDALKEKTQTDVAIHASSMNGENFPVGVMTRRSVMNSIPRVFDPNDKEGWSIYTAKIKGIWLKTVFEALASFGEPLSYSGIEMEYIKTPFGLKIGKATINGENISPFKEYSVAFTEGIIRGALEISPKTQVLLRNPEKTPYRLWETLQERVQEESSFRKSKINFNSLSDKNRTFFSPKKID